MTADGPMKAAKVNAGATPNSREITDPKEKKDEFKTISEGSATMCYPADQEQTVFYNPVQVQNRDLSILMIYLFQERYRKRFDEKVNKKQQNRERQKEQAAAKGEVAPAPEMPLPEYKGISILDALAASGLRSIRYMQEIPGVSHLTINDLEEAAVGRAHVNVKQNNLTEKLVEENSKDGIWIHQGDARRMMYTHSYHVVDLDPYGSAASFLDGAVQCVENGGLLCVTCTDMAALGGSHPETCFGRYGSMPIQRAGFLQEMALRILLNSMAQTAAKYGRTIRPVLSVGMDFYVRVFVEVHNSKAAVNDLSMHTGYVLQSTQCPSFTIVKAGQKGGKKNNVYQNGRVLPEQAVCSETGASMKLGGPIWLGPLHDHDVLDAALDKLPSMTHISTKQRLRGLLTSCREELNDVPLFYKLPTLAKVLSAQSPTLSQIQSALLHAGYRVSGYHKEPLAVKTDAPNDVIWDILRAWCNSLPTKPDQKKKLSEVATQIRQKEVKLESVNFDRHPALAQNRRDPSVKRFPHNPQPFWGPKPKARKRKAAGDDGSEPETEEATTG